MRIVQDTGLVFLRSLRPTLRQPLMIVLGATQPMLFLVLFGPLLGGTTGDGSWRWFVPGLVIQMALFGTSYAGFVLMPEIRSGVLERFQVTPISRTALLLGRVLRDVAVLLVQCVLLLALSTAFSFRAHGSELLVVLGLGALVGVMIATVSHALALTVRHEYVFGPILGGTVMPLLLLSGALLPMDRGPEWLYVLSRLNPLSYAVDAARAASTDGPAAPTVLLGAAVTLCCVAASLWWGTRTFRTENA